MIRGFLHNCVAHPLWWASSQAADGAFRFVGAATRLQLRLSGLERRARWLHDATAPESDG